MYNRYIASISFFFGYYYTFILLDKGFFEMPTFLLTRYITKLTVFFSINFYRYFFFGELLLILFSFSLYFFLNFFLNFIFFLEILLSNFISFLELSFNVILYSNILYIFV